MTALRKRLRMKNFMTVLTLLVWSQWESQSGSTGGIVDISA